MLSGRWPRTWNARKAPAGAPARMERRGRPASAQAEGQRRLSGVWPAFGAALGFLLAFWLAFILPGCGPAPPERVTTLVLVGGSGPDEALAKKQLQAFHKLHPEIRVIYQSTPSSASERHTLYVTWLSSRSAEIDVLSLDTIWVAEFAAAGWLVPLDGYITTAHFPIQIFCPRPWPPAPIRAACFPCPGLPTPGCCITAKTSTKKLACRRPAPLSISWRCAASRTSLACLMASSFPGQAYEGLVCVFLEFIWSNGGRIFDDQGRLVLDSPQNREALETLVNLIYRDGVSPLAVTTFIEEDCRHAFQQGYAVLMYNWPYAYSLMNQPGSPVKGKFALLPLVHGLKGHSTSCFGGGNLGVNAFSRHPEAAWKLIHFLLQPANRKAATEALGMLPPLQSLYRDPELQAKFPYLKSLQEVFFTARSRPITPLYSFIADILRIHVSRALTRQETPDQALKDAAVEIAGAATPFRSSRGAP